VVSLTGRRGGLDQRRGVPHRPLPPGGQRVVREKGGIGQGGNEATSRGWLRDRGGGGGLCRWQSRRVGCGSATTVVRNNPARLLRSCCAKVQWAVLAWQQHRRQTEHPYHTVLRSLLCAALHADASALSLFCLRRYQDRGLPFCYVGYFDGMEEGVLRANIIEAKVNNVSVRCAYTNPPPLTHVMGSEG
jgi:hypothetical protein